MTDRDLFDVVEINHYTGAEACHYECGDVAEFVVRGETDEGLVTFAGCRSCLKEARIYPIANGWVDERSASEKIRNS